jgi:hypothetical protein
MTLRSNPSHSSGASATPASASVSGKNTSVNGEMLAAHWLTAPTASPQLSDEEACVLVIYMELAHFFKDTRFIS